MMLEETKEINKTWVEIKVEAKNRVEMEDSCGSPMFRCGIMGCYIYIYILNYHLGPQITAAITTFL
jgi:hypothetical protein